MPADSPLEFGPNVDPSKLSDYSRSVLEDLLRRSNNVRARITSLTRSPGDQARVMFEKCEETGGVEHEEELYKAAGDAVVEVYVARKAAGDSPEAIKAAMEAKIIALGPTKVSRHCGDNNVLAVIDLAPSSLANLHHLESVAMQDDRVSKVLTPPKDPALHLELPQPQNLVCS